jgi:hypothetical protein
MEAKYHRRASDRVLRRRDPTPASHLQAGTGAVADRRVDGLMLNRRQAATPVRAVKCDTMRIVAQEHGTGVGMAVGQCQTSADE